MAFGSVKTCFRSANGFLTRFRKTPKLCMLTFKARMIWSLTAFPMPNYPQSLRPSCWPLSTCACPRACVHAVPALKIPTPDMCGFFLSFGSQSSLNPNLSSTLHSPPHNPSVTVIGLITLWYYLHLLVFVGIYYLPYVLSSPSPHMAGTRHLVYC